MSQFVQFQMQATIQDPIGSASASDQSSGNTSANASSGDLDIY